MWPGELIPYADICVQLAWHHFYLQTDILLVLWCFTLNFVLDSTAFSLPGGSYSPYPVNYWSLVGLLLALSIYPWTPSLPPHYQIHHYHQLIRSEIKPPPLPETKGFFPQRTQLNSLKPPEFNPHEMSCELWYLPPGWANQVSLTAGSPIRWHRH